MTLASTGYVNPVSLLEARVPIQRGVGTLAGGMVEIDPDFEVPERIPVIAFDFDGTLTTEDTFVGFMKYYHGSLRWYLKMLPLVPTFIRYKLGRIDRHAVKYAVTRAVFRDVPMAEVQARAESFAREVIPKLIRPEGIRHFEQRASAARNGGPQVVICSASIAPYLQVFFESHPDVEILACELEVDPNHICTGELRGYNVWGENKVKRLRERFGSDFIHLIEAYGDSMGDRAMLEVADTAFWRPFRLS